MNAGETVISICVAGPCRSRLSVAACSRANDLLSATAARCALHFEAAAATTAGAWPRVNGSDFLAVG
jgi:hypothetical protein